MKKQNRPCKVDGYKGEPHGFFNYGRSGNKPFIATLTSADRFLVSLGYLKGKPTVAEFFKIKKSE